MVDQVRRPTVKILFFQLSLQLAVVVAVAVSCPAAAVQAVAHLTVVQIKVQVQQIKVLTAVLLLAVLVLDQVAVARQRWARMQLEQPVAREDRAWQRLSVAVRYLMRAAVADLGRQHPDWEEAEEAETGNRLVFPAP